MLQKVEWGDRPGGRGGRRAFRNTVLIAMAALLVLLMAGAAQAVTPPRPDTDAQLPAILKQWPHPRPGVASPQGYSLSNARAQFLAG